MLPHIDRVCDCATQCKSRRTPCQIWHPTGSHRYPREDLQLHSRSSLPCNLAILRPFLAVGSANLPPISLAVRMCVPATKWRAASTQGEHAEARLLPATAAERVLPRAPSRVDSVPSKHLHASHVVHNGRVSQPAACAVCAVCAVCAAPLHSMRCGVPLIVTGVAKLGTRARTFVHHSACARACLRALSGSHCPKGGV